MALTKLSASKEGIVINNEIISKTVVETLRSEKDIETELTRRGKSLVGYTIILSRDAISDDPMVTVEQTGRRT